MRALLFDLDGTLISQQIDFGRMRRCVQELVEQYALQARLAPGLQILEIIAAGQHALQGEDAALAQRFVREALEAIAAIEVQAAETASAFEGVPEMLYRLRTRGYRVGIVTRNCRLAVERALARNPLLYDVLLTRDDVEFVKPDPRHLLAALQILQISSVQALMCGDHPMDIVAGKRAGMTTIAVACASAQAEHLAHAEPDLLLERVTDLKDYLSLGDAP